MSYMPAALWAKSIGKYQDCRRMIEKCVYRSKFIGAKGEVFRYEERPAVFPYQDFGYFETFPRNQSLALKKLLELKVVAVL